MKSVNLNFLEPSGLLQACNGTALPIYFTWRSMYVFDHVSVISIMCLSFRSCVPHFDHVSVISIMCLSFRSCVCHFDHVSLISIMCLSFRSCVSHFDHVSLISMCPSFRSCVSHFDHVSLISIMCLSFRSCVSHFFLEWKIHHTGAVERLLTYITCSINIFFQNIIMYAKIWKKYCRKGLATDDNMARAHCMLDS
jgi:hypothetical protein